MPVGRVTPTSGLSQQRDDGLCHAGQGRLQRMIQKFQAPKTKICEESMDLLFFFNLCKKKEDYLKRKASAPMSVAREK